MNTISYLEPTTLKTKDMETYLKTQEATIEAAEQARAENFGTFIKKGSYQCACGESFACYLIDEKTLNTLETFVYCEACHDRN